MISLACLALFLCPAARFPPDVLLSKDNVLGHILIIGWHYLSNATCLIRPCHLFVVFFVVSRITITC